MTLQAFWEALQASPLGGYIASSAWAFPTLETIHVIAIVSVIGSIAVMDLRLLGLASSDRPVTEISKDTLPITWAAFVIAVLTGSLLFVARPASTPSIPTSSWKMVLIALAGVNMAVFHLFGWRTVAAWDTERTAHHGREDRRRAVAALWITVVFFARAIGFTLDLYSS